MAQARHPITFALAKKLLIIISVGLPLAGCSQNTKPRTEAPPSAPAPVEAGQAPQLAKLPAPQTTEVDEAIKRVFAGSAIRSTGQEPSFMVGDFNGDSSQDLAVVLMPVPEKIPELNQQFPTWILRDLSHDQQSNGPRLRVAVNDVLLAVIHGYGTGGWRERDATQTYLLKHAVGSGMATRPLKDLRAANKDKKLPQLRGDVITQVAGGQAGFLYFGNATYSWYDPKTFTGDQSERSMIHTAQTRK